MLVHSKQRGTQKYGKEKEESGKKERKNEINYKYTFHNK